MKQLILNYIQAVEAFDKSATAHRKEAVKIAKEKLLKAMEGME